MDRDQQQGQRAIELGLVTPDQVRLAYQSPRRSPTHDLSALLLEHGLISTTQAQSLRLPAHNSDSPYSSESAPITPAESTDAVTATLHLPSDQASQIAIQRGPNKTQIHASSSSGPDQHSNALLSQSQTVDNEQGRRRAAIAEAYEQERRFDPLFAPHADGVLDRKEQLGTGGMGEVYRVFDKRLGRQAALKILRQDKTRKERLSRFLREGQITARLEHPAIPPIYEAGTNCAGQHYLLMKVIEGESLSERIGELHRHGQPPFEKFRPYLEALIPVCEAVSYAHNQGVIHRDLKPDNIMLGEFGEVMVMDWGIARDLKNEGSADDVEVVELENTELQKEGLTLDGAVIGTPGFMSPEQANGQGVAQQADVFALGAILTSLLTGSGPIRGDSSFKLIVSTIKGSIESPRDRVSSIPKALDAIAKKALAVKLEDRFQSVDQFSRELKAYLSGRRVSVYKYSLGERLAIQLKRHPGLVMGLFAATIMISISGLLGVQTYNTQLREADATRLESTFAERLKRLETSQRNFSLALDLVRKDVDPEEVRERIREALKNSDRGLDKLLFAASIYEDGKLYSDALELLNEAADKFAPAYEALYAMHRLTVQQNMTTGFADTPALKRLVALAREKGESNEYTLMYEAFEKHNQGKYEAAIRIFDKIQSTKKDHGMIFTFRGCSYLLLGRLNKAFDDFKRAISLDPLDSTALHYRGLCHERNNDDKQALVDYSRSLKLNQDQAIVYARRALVWERQKNLDNALQDMERAISIDPTNPEHYKNKGSLLAKNGKSSKAIPSFNKMVKLAPDNLFYLEMRAKNNIICSNYAQAKEDLALIIERDPKNAEAYLTRGSLNAILTSRESKTQAIRDLTKAIELKDHNALAYSTRAQVYEQLRQYDKALVDLNILISLDARNFGAYFARAKVHASLNNNKECMKDLKFVYQRAPATDPARLEAVKVLIKMRDPEVMADLKKN